ncbi:hypothetical protein JC607_02335 [Paracoccus sp. IB05]|nr:hypothetical protein [Paracoccus sp. IB05]
MLLCPSPQNPRPSPGTPASQMRLYDSDPAARTKCAANLRSFGLDVTDCATAEEAIPGAHVITTCT